MSSNAELTADSTDTNNIASATVSMIMIVKEKYTPPPKQTNSKQDIDSKNSNQPEVYKVNDQKDH